MNIVSLIFFSKLLLCMSKSLLDCSINSSMSLCNGFQWMIFLDELSVSCHVPVYDRGNVSREGNKVCFVLLKITFSFLIDTGRRAGGGDSSNTNHTQDTAPYSSIIAFLCLVHLFIW